MEPRDIIKAAALKKLHNVITKKIEEINLSGTPLSTFKIDRLDFIDGISKDEFSEISQIVDSLNSNLNYLRQYCKLYDIII